MREPLSSEVQGALRRERARKTVTHSIWLPKDLHQKTQVLVCQFAEALAEKLANAERKYGYSDGWADPTWMDECRAKLREHVEKGDARDVAAYCAFLWFHNESTSGNPKERQRSARGKA